MTTDAINRVKEAELEAKSLVDAAKLEATNLKKLQEKNALKFLIKL